MNQLQRSKGHLLLSQARLCRHSGPTALAETSGDLRLWMPRYGEPELGNSRSQPVPQGQLMCY